MATDLNTVSTPNFTGTIDQRFFLAPLGGPKNPVSYLDRFPDELYNKSLDSHLVRFLYALLGPAGIGWLRKNYLDARLKLEDFGLETFELDRFYANPLKFGRILEEIYDEDPSGLLSPTDWERIRAKDSRYRNRALDYVTGARAGNTPLGMHLVARSGLGHEAEIVENYRYVYDQLSDDPIGIPHQGKTMSTEEMIVVPRRELPRSEVQTITISGTPTGGTFTLFFPIGDETSNTSTSIAHNATRDAIQLILENITSIGIGNVKVYGGPLPDTPIEIHFTGDLAYRDVPKLTALSALTGGTAPTITVVTSLSGVDQAEETVSISPRDQQYLREALDRIKPVTTIVSFNPGNGLASRQVWNNATGSSSYIEVQRYVTGSADVSWPAPTPKYWIEPFIENRAPKAKGGLSHHYQGFHDTIVVYSYTEEALNDPSYLSDRSVLEGYRNEHIGPFSTYQKILFPILNRVVPIDFQYNSDMVLADYAEPLTVQQKTHDGSTSLINGIYPVEYQDLPGVPAIKYRDDQFWASIERPTGDDYLELDLGIPQPINFLSFEATGKPFDISVDYDLLDQGPARSWKGVTLTQGIPSVTSLGYTVSTVNPWVNAKMWFENSLGETIFTRYLRIKFSRRNDPNSPFTESDGTLLPYSLEVRNLRVGRNNS